MGDKQTPWQSLDTQGECPSVIENWTIVGIRKNSEDRNYEVELVLSTNGDKTTICNAHEAFAPRKKICCDEKSMWWYAQRIGHIICLQLRTMDYTP